MDLFMHKNGITIMLLSRIFLSYSENSKIPTISEFSEEFSCSRGTVQSAIKFLENEGAVTLHKHGYQGTYIERINYHKLWMYTRWGTLTGCMPLPHSKHFEGLATAIYLAMDRRQIPFHFTYMQGAQNRINMLLSQKCDFIIMSKMTINNWLEKHPDLKIAYELYPHSFVSRNVLVCLNQTSVPLQDGISVAVDSFSPDHVKLTNICFADKNVNYVNISYNSILNAIFEKKVDAAIYNLDTLNDEKYSYFNNYFRIFDIDNKEIGTDYTKAIILINQKSHGLINLLNTIINPNMIRTIQDSVKSGKIAPHY